MTDLLEPLGLSTGPGAAALLAAGQAARLQGGPVAFTHLRRVSDGAILPAAAAAPPILTAAPPAIPGLPAHRPLVMGIVNVTPDSFSGDGIPAAAAIAQGEAMLAAGADMLDIGGESTRPGAAPVTPGEEAERILPVVQALARLAPVSIDTRHATTMRAALEAGALMVNDVSGLRHDPAAAGAVAAAGVPVVLMHMRDLDPRRMQQDLAEDSYADVALEVTHYLAARITAAEAAGIARRHVLLDPGIGFGKTVAQNLALVERLPLLANLGCWVLLGASRKGFIGRLGGEPEAARRQAGSLAVALAGAARGAAILRVHDVAETVQALRLWRALAA